MEKRGEMTRYAFISHMEDYMKKLLSDPLKADTDDFLKSYGIDGPKAIEILTMRSDPKDEKSAVMIKTARIKDNGVDENGKKSKDTFSVTYKIPRDRYTNKMRDLYIKLFESNIIEGTLLNEEDGGAAPAIGGDNGGGNNAVATNTDANNISDTQKGAGNASDSGQYVKPLFGKKKKDDIIRRTFNEGRKTVFITEEQVEFLKEEGEGSIYDRGWTFDAPFNKGEGGKKFYATAMNHKNIIQSGIPEQ